MTGPNTLVASAAEISRTAERVARESYGRLLAILAPRTRDVASAEDALAEGFAEALQRWPITGIPRHPEAWLLTVARRRQTDALRRRYTTKGAEGHLQLLAEEIEAMGEQQSAFPDRRLALLFACADPAIDKHLHALLMLQTLLGLNAEEIGAAYLVPPKTMGQRLVRAKAHIKATGITLQVPDPDQVPARLPSVLDALYAAFTREWIGQDRHDLSKEAIWLAELVVSLLPQDPELNGLLALLLYFQARRPAMRSPEGSYVPLDQQDPSRWDKDLVESAEAMLHAANRGGPSGRYQIEAAIQSAHCARRFGGTTNWRVIAALYDLLFVLVPTPVVALNRALARRHLQGPGPSLKEVRTLGEHKAMLDYQPYWAARAQLAAELGAIAEADEAYTFAIGLCADPAVRSFLMARRDTLQVRRDVTCP